jgi:hypothetical protein
MSVVKRLPIIILSYFAACLVAGFIIVSAMAALVIVFDFSKEALLGIVGLPLMGLVAAGLTAAYAFLPSLAFIFVAEYYEKRELSWYVICGAACGLLGMCVYWYDIRNDPGQTTAEMLRGIFIFALAGAAGGRTFWRLAVREAYQPDLTSEQL